MNWKVVQIIVLGGCFLIICIMVFIPIFNAMLAGITSGVFKWFKPKRYNTKKSPIYKMVYNGWEDKYYIQKWELGWKGLNQRTPDSIWVVPFSGLFKYYQYIKCDDVFGGFSEDTVITLPIDFDLEAYYEKEYGKKYVKELEEGKKITIFQQKLGGLNKEFNENFE